MNVLNYLQQLFAQSLAQVHADSTHLATMVRPTQEAKFGDYQANCAMPLSKQVGGNPRQVAQQLIDHLPQREIFQTLEIAGPGFINMRLTDEFLTQQLHPLANDEKLGVEPLTPTKTVVIDFSSPNVAKPMHVGHLRSTVIGDALARIFRELGWRVITDNHLGDWGTQFGMIIYGWRHYRDESAYELNPLDELSRLYKKVRRLTKAEEEAKPPIEPVVTEASRLETARLHQGDPANLALWKQFLPICLEDLHRIYKRLGIQHDYEYGESYFQPMLADVVAELEQLGLAKESAGALIVEFPDLEGKTDEAGNIKQRFNAPFIVRKSDGAFNYATTDLACIKQRVQDFQPDLILYVVDSRQTMHFQQLFDTARRWGYTDVQLEHIAFGMVLGKDGTPLKSRDGEPYLLDDLLNEAIAFAKRVVDANSSHLPEPERLQIAQMVGIGAVKYSDLVNHRLSDYKFDLDKMVDTDGNTATYVQYAYARCCSILRKGEVDRQSLRLEPPAIQFVEPNDRSLAITLLRYAEAVAAAAADYRPNLLVNYIYELACELAGFYNKCQVLNAATPELRASRVYLVDLTARTLERGLGLLGIGVAERM